MTYSDRFSFVLVRPKSSGNIGAAARALKNMGFADLRLVAPPHYDRDRATARAVHAADLLDSARIYPDFLSAIDDCTIVVGTTARSGPYRNAALPLREAAAELAEFAPANRIAIAFGPEDFGLTNEDLKLCHRLITIPTAPAYPSLNLSQAVMVTAYELAAALGATPSRESPVEPFAPAGEVAAMFDRLTQALIYIGFIAEDNHDHIIFALRVLLGRSGIHSRELDILNGIARQLRWFSEGGHATLSEKRRAGQPLR